jgi:hypothetical protein
MVDFFNKGRVFLAGDAAHTHAPTGASSRLGFWEDSRGKRDITRVLPVLFTTVTWTSLSVLTFPLPRLPAPNPSHPNAVHPSVCFSTTSAHALIRSPRLPCPAQPCAGRALRSPPARCIPRVAAVGSCPSPEDPPQDLFAASPPTSSAPVMFAATRPGASGPLPSPAHGWHQVLLPTLADSRRCRPHPARSFLPSVSPRAPPRPSPRTSPRPPHAGGRLAPVPRRPKRSMPAAAHPGPDADAYAITLPLSPYAPKRRAGARREPSRARVRVRWAHSPDEDICA